MYVHIQKIIINNKIKLQTGFIKRVLKKLAIPLTESKIYIIQTVLICISNMIFIPMGVLFINKYVQQRILISGLMIIEGLFAFFKGINNYKNVYMPPFYKWYEISPINNRKLYYSLLFVDIMFSFITNGNIAALIISLIVLNGFQFSTFILCINLIITLLTIYILSGHIYAKYIYSLTIKKISYFRLFIYSFWSIAILIITEKFVECIYNIFFLPFKTESIDLLSDEFWLNYFNSVETLLGYYKDGITSKLILISNNFNIYSFLICCAILLIVLLLPIKFIPADTQGVVHKHDLLDTYLSFLCKVSKKTYIIKDLLLTIKKFRWSLIKSFFQIVFLDYEAIFYIGLFYQILYYVDDYILQIHLLMLMNIQVLNIQAFEIRQILAAYFSFSNNLNNLRFLKLYSKNYLLVKDKESVIRKMMIIPFALILLINCLCISIYSIKFSAIVLLIPVDFLYFMVCPIIQTHMLPITVNFQSIDKQYTDQTFEEKELADTLQEVPRIFTNLIPTIFTITFLIFNEHKLLLVIEYIYICFAVCLSWRYCEKFEKKGMQKLYDKIM